MAGITPIAPLPFPPSSYEQRYFNETIRTLNLYFRQLQNPGAIVGSTLQLTNMPTSASGLRVGEAWIDTAAGNVIKVVL